MDGNSHGSGGGGASLSCFLVFLLFYVRQGQSLKAEQQGSCISRLWSGDSLSLHLRALKWRCWGLTLGPSASRASLLTLTFPEKGRVT